MNIFKNYQKYDPMRRFVNCTIIFSIFLILLSAYPGGASGASFYVKNGGNDSLDGRSDATAWATIAKVRNIVASGDTVYFRSQDTWESATPPLLSATAGVTYDGSTYGSGTRAKLKATGGYTGASVDGVVNLYASNVTFKGFEVDGNKQILGGVYLGLHAQTDTTNITVDNCVIHDNGGVESVPTEYYYGIIVGAGTYHTLSNVKIINTEVYNTGHEGIAVYPSRGTYGGVPSLNYVHDVLIRNCIVHDTAHWGGTTWGNGIDAANHVDNLTIEFNTVYNAGSNGIAVATYADIPSPGSPDNVTIRYNLLYNNATGISIIPSAGNGHYGNTYVYGNILINNGIELSDGNYNSTIQKIYNNTIFIPTASKYGLYFNYGASNTSNVEFKNNILFTNVFPVIKDEDVSLKVHSNNLLFRPSGTLVITTTRNYSSSDIEVWESSVKKTNPNFNGGSFPTGFTGTYGSSMIPNTDYFSIATGEAINNGATLGSPYNGCINGAGLTITITRPQGAAYDIGAYENTTLRPAPTGPVLPPTAPRIVN